MADDARISTAFPNHPKTKMVRKRLGDKGAWALLCLFLWVADNKPDGDLSGMRDEEIEVAVDWTGDDGLLVQTLRDVRFLDGESGQYRVHDWGEHNPWAASRPQRIEKARHAALKRWGIGIAKAIQDECPEDATGIPLADSSNALHAPTHPQTKEVTTTTAQGRTRRKKGDLTGYSHPEEIKQLRDYLFPKWPKERNDGSKVDRSEVQFAAQVDELLNGGWSVDTLIRSADLYLKEKPGFAACPHNFFGPGKGNPGNFKIYAKMILHNEKANGNGHDPQSRLPEICGASPQGSAGIIGAS